MRRELGACRSRRFVPCLPWADQDPRGTARALKERSSLAESRSWRACGTYERECGLTVPR
jgi:hypothetical protein